MADAKKSSAQIHQRYRPTRAAVAQRLGVYTVDDYADIVAHLVKVWNVAGRSVSGKAARAQDFLCAHAEKCREMAPQVAEQAAKQPAVPFHWVFGRSV